MQIPIWIGSLCVPVIFNGQIKVELCCHPSCHIITNNNTFLRFGTTLWSVFYLMNYAGCGHLIFGARKRLLWGMWRLNRLNCSSSEKWKLVEISLAVAFIRTLFELIQLWMKFLWRTFVHRPPSSRIAASLLANWIRFLDAKQNIE